MIKRETFPGALKRSFPRINARAPTGMLREFAPKHSFWFFCASWGESSFAHFFKIAAVLLWVLLDEAGGGAGGCEIGMVLEVGAGGS
jgi:hypothetical protein